ncbi:fumarylacetoacetate hydrolase family protein [Motiliproteus sp. SC1-56]|uniref:fumarylacetoacetate hydrolase family protein n=1 Tax=Motiliproteus sp. SC1-56 TaxID=2799565 RepID=UPI001A8E579F|nr:fumarylacetoacetate hydrolase family protein [Motiliproteus sp. SC1-56]
MSYHHRRPDGRAIDLPIGKIVCVGRNYAEHARELGNAVPKEPLLFLKPNTSHADLAAPLVLPRERGECHHELELCVLIGRPLCGATEEEVATAVAGYGLGLDLTLRDEQNRLKAQGHPWERAKAFDASAPLSGFLPVDAVDDVDQLDLRLWVNGEPRQAGNTNQMTLPVHALIAYCSRFFSLLPGDVVMTGTPAGVGPLNPGDALRMQLGEVLEVRTRAR